MRSILLCAVAFTWSASPSAARASAIGVTDGEVRFGISAPFSGPAKEYGRQLRVGVEVAFAVANENGGVAGRQLRLVAMDDSYDPARTSAAVRDLVERQQVFGLVGVLGTANSAAVLPYVLEKQVLYFAPGSGAAFLRKEPPDRVVFNYRPSYADEAAAAVNYLVRVRRFRPSEIAVFMQDDVFGEAGWEGVARAMRRLGRDPARVLRVTYQRSNLNVGPAVETIRRNAPHLRAVVMAAVYKPAARFIGRLRAAGVNLVFTNLSAVSATELAEELLALGPVRAEGVIVTQVVPLPTSQSTAILRYQEALRRHASSESPDYLSLEAYISASILVEGLRRAGRNLTSDTLVDALETIHGLDLGLATPITFAPSEHQGSHKVWGTVLDRKGNYQTLDLE